MLRPVSSRYTTHGGGGLRQYGPIAEQVAAVLPELVVYDRSGQPEMVCYYWLPAILLNELQKQHRMLGDQMETTAAQQASLADLQARLTQLEQLLAMRAGR